MNALGRIRAISPEELELMLSWRNATNVRANMYTRHVISLDEHLAWWANVREREDVRYFMYEFQEIPSGIVGLTEIDRDSANCCWAFYASPDAPKGSGVRMEYLTLEYAFNDLNLVKIYCEVLAFNKSVIKLHQKFGFQVEGIFRQQHRVDGQLTDIYRLGLLSGEWAAKREELLPKLLHRKEAHHV
ncbi:MULTISPECIES: UDP-4-amino-4,6-dideoxy-N-acetyl-beta-L-altrosamine N-acetyltransferase [Sphingobium]|uniref:Flagellin modification protein FlmH n=1 Tax=Sphingobium chungbukense TaxID=56193 RepID=A0A0M3APT4_9SPHN|nr:MULTISPECIES: UDP-4-amino-4,6-dideoxy-N-acetyl-beta-L-altrosamine N-acetyltransferase [Sphingobium]AMK26080.1 flagellin modification protein FlmH [Sphingobium sp. TKS]KKW90554.1 flagellin modification protein FlmH [Sphingobium chungbukense]